MQQGRVMSMQQGRVMSMQLGRVISMQRGRVISMLSVLSAPWQACWRKRYGRANSRPARTPPHPPAAIPAAAGFRHIPQRACGRPRATGSGAGPPASSGEVIRGGHQVASRDEGRLMREIISAHQWAILPLESTLSLATTARSTIPRSAKVAFSILRPSCEVTNLAPENCAKSSRN